MKNILLCSQFQKENRKLTVRCPLIISGAIQPSVPVTPDRLEKLVRPRFNFLHNPKSDIIALTVFEPSGSDNNTFCGLISRCTETNNGH